MGNKNKVSDKSRRHFLSLFMAKKETSTEKIKMLTPDGKLVEVDKAVIQQASKNQKATNQEIYAWMKNPSKEND